MTINSPPGKIHQQLVWSGLLSVVEEQALEGQVPAVGASCPWDPVLYAGHGIAGKFGNATPCIATAPIVGWRKEYLTDSGGPGRNRGGRVRVMEIENLENAPFAMSAMFDRVRCPAEGPVRWSIGTPGRRVSAAIRNSAQGQGPSDGPGRRAPDHGNARWWLLWPSPGARRGSDP